MNMKGILPLVILGGLAWALSKMFQPAGTTSQPGGPTDELPGYTFPAPGEPGVVTNAIGEVVAENYVIGTAQQAYENAQEIKATAAAALAAHAPLGLISSYNQVRQFDTNRYQVPGYEAGVMADFYDPVSGRYLDISPYGWVVFGMSEAYLGDPPGGRMHNLYGQGGSFGGLTHELPGWLAV
jgi:hypothetical protein